MLSTTRKSWVVGKIFLFCGKRTAKTGTIITDLRRALFADVGAQNDIHQTEPGAAAQHLAVTLIRASGILPH